MLNLLIMEDDVDQGLLLSAGLQDAGHQVKIAHNSDEAWLLLTKERFDVLITDIFVRTHTGSIEAGQGGIALIGKIRQTRIADIPEDNRNMKIIALTGSGGGDSDYDPLKDATLVGADATLRKPATFEEILCTIRLITKSFET